jgi:hypothetical protein
VSQLPALSETQYNHLHRVGQTAANEVIEHYRNEPQGRERIQLELTTSDALWNDPTINYSDTETSLALLSGYRDTLREYLERGSDA